LGDPTTISGTQADTQPLAPAFSAAKTDLDSAISDAASRTDFQIVKELGGSTLVSGVYSAAASDFLTLTGTITLDAEGDSNAVFIIKSPTYLVSAAGSQVVLANGARASNVFFFTGTHVLLGANTILKGNVLATDYVSFGADVQVEGHIFSKASYVIFGAGTRTTTPPPLSPARTPTIGSVTATTDGFTATITNYDSSFTWSATASAGSVINSGADITVTGVAANTYVTATITSSKTGSETGSLAVSSTSLDSPSTSATLSTALTPELGSITPTATGFTSTITNYDSSFTWSATASAGSVAISGAEITVTGVAANTYVTATITSSKTGSETGSLAVSSTSLDSPSTSATLSAALTPELGSITPTATGFTATITNYNSTFTWSASASAGSVAISGAEITVTGLAPSTSATVTITSTMAGLETGSFSVTGISLDSAFVPTIGLVTPTANGFTATITNHDPNYTWSGSVTSGSVGISRTGVITVAGVTPSTNVTLTIMCSKLGSVTCYRDVEATSLSTPDPISSDSPPASPSASLNQAQTPPLIAPVNPAQTLPSATPAPRVKPVVPVTPVARAMGTIAGSAEKVTIVANGPREKLIASSGAWKVEIKAELIGGQSKPIPEKLTLDFQIGSEAALSGTGLNPKAKVSVYVFSEPTFVGDLETLADGSFATSMLLPASILPGNHTLQLLTTDLDGNQIVLNIPITVSGKVTVGTFKGYLAIYTKDLMGQRLSARVDGKWLVQDPITKYKNFNYSRQIRSVGIGYKISVDLYLNSNFFRTDVITSR
jgi:hypothetical protein